MDRVLTDWHDFQREASTWQFAVGPLRFRSAFKSMRFARYFVDFHLLVGATGGVLIFARGPARDLGMALVVGALFAFGAFVAQVWSVQVQEERNEAHQARHADLIDRYNRAVEQQTRNSQRN